MSDEFFGGILLLPLLLLGAGALLLGTWLRSRSAEGARDGSRRVPGRELPLLVFPTHRDPGGAGARRRFEAFPPIENGPPLPEDGTPTDPGRVGPDGAPPGRADPRRSRDRAQVELDPRQAPNPPPGPDRPAPRPLTGHQTPPDGTLQLLPGRLEVCGGPGAGEEIRFVRLPGLSPEISFGRAEGPEFRHVRLASPTVSRRQARITFDGENWSIRNESSRNPTSVNGRPLSSDLEVVPLRDGDRIEMGEVRLIFRHAQVRDRLPARSSWHTDLGRRPTNQDAVVVRSLPGGRELAAVCDGMGSHHAGGEASHLALEVLVASLSAGAGLVDAVKEANAQVLAAARQGPERDGIGTTLVALLRDGATYQIANVGDSRAYRVTAHGIRQLTEDHSFVAEATREGRMSLEEALRSPWRNAVTRNLGASDQVEVDLLAGFDAEEVHRVVLCTDGVHGVLAADEIAEICRETTEIRDLARALSEQALVRGGEDNVGVAAMAFGSSVTPPPLAATDGPR